MTTHTFITHTAADLEDEEMEVITPHSHYNPTRAHPLSHSHSPNGTCPTPGLDLSGGTLTGGLGRLPNGQSTTTGQGHLSGLAQLALDSLDASATDTLLDITTFSIHNGPHSPLAALPLPCNRPT